MIKLTPEHVGGRVLLSDGCVGLIENFHGDHVAVCHGTWREFFDLSGFHMADGDVPQCFDRITLLLDAPNPVDVEVPEWCDDVILWFHEEPEKILGWAEFQDRRRASHVQPSLGWSPAPGQLPPKEQRGV